MLSLILQTLQQLRKVYGDDSDKIIQGNVSNIIFLKSTDDAMIDTLQKMSGTTHRVFTNSKTVTKDLERIVLQNEGKISYTMSSQEVPVISYNDMAFINERNSIVFRAGDAPIWNRNETILPMSWRLMRDDIKHPGHTYSFQTIPTLSSAKDFDVRKNQPDFQKMFDKRLRQALAADDAKEAYANIYGYTDYQIGLLDPDLYSNDIMEFIDVSLRAQDAPVDDDYDESEFADGFDDAEDSYYNKSEENKEVTSEYNRRQEDSRSLNEPRYAGRVLSRADLIGTMGHPVHSIDKELIEAYVEVKGDMWNDRDMFSVVDGNLCSRDGRKVYIRALDESLMLKTMNREAKKEDSPIFSDGSIRKDELSSLGSYEVTDDFLFFLAAQDRWSFARGRFDNVMRRILADGER